MAADSDGDASSSDDDDEDDDEDDEDDDDDDDDGDDSDDASASEDATDARTTETGESALGRHLRLGETLTEARAEALKTQKVTFPREDASDGSGKRNAWEGANGLEVPRVLERPELVNAKLTERWLSLIHI